MSNVKLGLIVVLIAGGISAVSTALRSGSETFAAAQALPPGVELLDIGGVSIPMGSPLPL